VATSLTAEIRHAAAPISIQTLPSTGDFQDHVSFGLVAARRTRDVLNNARHILAVELICAAQAADIRGLEDLSSATRKLHAMVRRRVPYLDHDEPFTDHIEAVAGMFETGELLDALPRNCEAYDW
jgi:histidine ammonia-lyase